MSTAATAAGRSSVFGRFLSTTIGLKMLMAATGFIWVGFIIGHMIGNLQIFLPLTDTEPHPLNRYAHFLQSLGGMLWLARTVLLVSFVAHVVSAARLNAINRAARTIEYKVKRNLQAPKTSYYMLLSGLVLLSFLVYHLAHLTWHITDPALAKVNDVHGLVDVYGKMMLTFKQPVIVGLYVVANISVGLHLHHAVSSMVQTLGLRTPSYAALVDKLGPAVGGLVIVGNLSIPLAIWLGVIGA